MPQTAAMRGLTNAFEPLQALRESASYLRELRTTFRGNLGLAAAAYNAGPGPVEAWLARRSVLPAETQAYVMIVTGYAPEAWASKSPPQLEFGRAALDPGNGRALRRDRQVDDRADAPPSRSHRQPGLGAVGCPACRQLDRSRRLAAYQRLRRKYSAVLGDRLPLVLDGRRRAGSPFLVRVSEESRQAANALCAKLMAAGGACIVLRNPRS